MRSKPCKANFHDLSKFQGPSLAWGREDCQEGWHRFFYDKFQSEGWWCSVLDVGAGMGFSKFRINNCYTQDPWPSTDVDFHCALDEFPTGSFDCVTAFDVIEHVVEDLDFLAQLLRIARRYVFVTTPNEEVSGARNGCHAREYSTEEFARLLQVTDPVTRGRYPVHFFSGDGPGNEIKEMKWDDPERSKYPHQAALVEKS